MQSMDFYKNGIFEHTSFQNLAKGNSYFDNYNFTR